MNYTIIIEVISSCRIIHTSLNGKMFELLRDNIAFETVNTMRRENISKVLWDVRETELEHSLIGSHQAIVNLEALGVRRTDSIAVVYKNNSEQHEYASVVASNRGITNVRYFNDLQSGIDWLLSR